MNEEQTHRAPPELSIVEKKRMTFYEIPDTKCFTRWERKPHAKKAAVHYAVHFLSRGNLKNLMPIDPSLFCASFTAAVPSAIITRRCVLYATLAKP